MDLLFNQFSVLNIADEQISAEGLAGIYKNVSHEGLQIIKKKNLGMPQTCP